MRTLVGLDCVVRRVTNPPLRAPLIETSKHPSASSSVNTSHWSKSPTSQSPPSNNRNQALNAPDKPDHSDAGRSRTLFTKTIPPNPPCKSAK